MVCVECCGIDIKICDAWQILTGNNITVAVLDVGIDLDHPDLAANIHPLSWDSDSRTSPQINPTSYHGTFCAGIISAARDNVVNNITIGIAGVTPDSKVIIKDEER
jgi:subtilisin family serine protease